MDPSILLSLRIKAPFAQHDAITEIMGLSESERLAVGPPAKVRMRTKLIPLERQNWSLRLVTQEEDDLALALRSALDWMEAHREGVDQVAALGLKKEFFVSYWSADRFGYVLEPEMLRALAHWGVAVLMSHEIIRCAQAED